MQLLIHPNFIFMRNPNISIGDRFKMLVVLERLGSRNKKRYWKCLCDCGNVKEVSSAELNYGRVKSCGCLKTQVLGIRSRTHGQSMGGKVTSVYNAWRGMIHRCYNPNATRFENHGGRGIKVCDRWLQSFENFFEDMGDKPTSLHSLDRHPNNDGDYELSNCRWATQRQQCANRRNSKYCEYDGKNMIISDWARYLNVNDRTLRDYIERNGIVKAVLHYTKK